MTPSIISSGDRVGRDIKGKKFNRLSKGNKHLLISIFRIVFLLATSYVLLYPLFLLISNAIKSSADYIDPSVVWVPRAISFSSFQEAWKAIDYPKALINTIVIEILSSLIGLVSCSVVAYGMARYKMPESSVLKAVLLLLIIVPMPMVALPMSLNFHQMDFFGILNVLGRIIGKDIRPNILDTPLTFYFPALLGVGLNSGLIIFIFLQFFRGLPKELEEASSIDGASPLLTYVAIIVPSSGAVFLTTLIFSLIWNWNDYYMALVCVPNVKTLSTALANFDSVIRGMGYDTSAPQAVAIKSAACLLSILPELVVFMLLQKKFIKSIDRVGIVG